jgi:hypothetical protein
LEEEKALVGLIGIWKGAEDAGCAAIEPVTLKSASRSTSLTYAIRDRDFVSLSTQSRFRKMRDQNCKENIDSCVILRMRG